MGPLQDQAVTSKILVAAFSFAYNLHTITTMEQNLSPLPDIFSELRERIYRIENTDFFTLSKVQYISTIDEIITSYFRSLNNIPVEIIENLVEEIIELNSASDEFKQRIIVEVKEDNPFLKDFEPTEVRKAALIQRALESIINELTYYEDELNKLIEQTNQLNTQNIKNGKGRLKFNLQMKEVLGLMRLFKECNIIETNELKDIANFVAQNFSTIGKDEDYQISNLQKHMNPSSKTLLSLQDKLVNVQKELVRMKKTRE